MVCDATVQYLEKTTHAKQQKVNGGLQVVVLCGTNFAEETKKCPIPWARRLMAPIIGYGSDDAGDRFLVSPSN